MATTNDLKNGLVLNLDGELWAIVEFQHVKPGKGGAFVRTTLKNVLSGKVVDRTFNAGTKVETATVDKRTMQYLYADGDDYVFMDLESFDQIPVQAATVGDAAKYLLPEAEATVATHEGVPLYVELPTSVILEIAYTVALVEGVAGDRDRIDELISSYAEGWTIDRMPIVDRNLARIAVFELLHSDDVDDAVAITEAVELARTLSTDDSPRFLNG